MIARISKQLLAVGLLTAAIVAVSAPQADAYGWGGYAYSPVVRYPAYYHRPLFYRPAFYRAAYYRPAFYRPVFYRPIFYRPAFYRPYRLYAPWYGVRFATYGYDPCCSPCYTPCYDPCYNPCCDPCGGFGVVTTRVVPNGTVTPNATGTPTPAQPPAQKKKDGTPRLVPVSPPMTMPPATNLPETPARSDAPARPWAQPKSGSLEVDVPVQARVFINGQPTSITGTHRHYVSYGLTPGYQYAYDVRVQMMRDGKLVEQSKKVQLQAGQTAKLAFDFNAPQPVQTRLTLHVPSNAKVYLSGNKTVSTGPTRQFVTTTLANGKEWKDYTIRVTVQRNGQLLTQERTVSLQAGDSRSVQFDFNETKLAADVKTNR